MLFKELLKERKITQKEIVAELKNCGRPVYQQQVSEWLTGKRLPDIFIVFELARIMNCSTDLVIDAIRKTRGLQ